MKHKNQAALCPCSGKAYSSCCQPLHTGQAVAQTPEQLMRSRYSAYALGLSHYVLLTWHPSTRPSSLDLADAEPGKWVGLTVVAASQEAQSGHVEFIARFKPSHGPASRMHEASRFLREGGQWFYVDGEFLNQGA